MRPKFCEISRDADPAPVPHRWKPVYERVRLKNRDSVVAAIANSGIDLILKLTDQSSGPFGILYVLVVPRRTQPGRYQLKEWLDRVALVAYLETYRAYLEGDGRHHLWIKCGDNSLIVYDRHETIYLYGDLEEFCGLLDSLGYSEGEVRIDFPHEHNYNCEFDDEERSIADSDEYMRFDLVPGQDYERDDPRFESA